jgi:hypothetical protein
VFIYNTSANYASYKKCHRSFFLISRVSRADKTTIYAKVEKFGTTGSVLNKNKIYKLHVLLKTNWKTAAFE